MHMSSPGVGNTSLLWHFPAHTDCSSWGVRGEGGSSGRTLPIRCPPQTPEAVEGGLGVEGLGQVGAPRYRSVWEGMAQRSGHLAEGVPWGQCHLGPPFPSGVTIWAAFTNLSLFHSLSARMTNASLSGGNATPRTTAGTVRMSLRTAVSAEGAAGSPPRPSSLAVLPGPLRAPTAPQHLRASQSSRALLPQLVLENPAAVLAEGQHWRRGKLPCSWSLEHNNSLSLPKV